jgi:hypothetical protein
MRNPALLLGLLVFLVALAVRLPDLGASTNVDAVLYWFGRTRKFWDALHDGRFHETYFSPHPGVSVMWLSGAAMSLTGTLSAPVTEMSVIAATAPLTVLASLAERSAVLVAGALTLVFAGRLARLFRVHPVPIAWCASYPGLRCEDVITLGNGEGFREAARFIAKHSPVKNPSVLSAYAGGAVLSPWLRFRRVRDGKQADFVVTYLSSDQRGLDPATRRFAVGEPLHEVRLDGRTYVRVFKGPAYPERGSERR